MSKQIDSMKLRSTNRQSNDNMNVSVDRDPEKTKKGVVKGNILLDSHVNLEVNKMNLNKVVKRGNILKRKAKITEKSVAMSSKCLTSFIKQKSFGSEKIRREYLKALKSPKKSFYW